ncbi:Uncharacterised protein [Mycobacteroides abscessus subsp. massiliense]|nr:Uncharacterised protein [Mycobacteroides abscessus subsp. massiliense]
MLSTVKFSSAKPSLANSAPSNSPIFCDSKTWFAAISKNGIPELPNAAANWVTAILRSWFSKSTPLYCAATPQTSLKNFAGSLIR